MGFPQADLLFNLEAVTAAAAEAAATAAATDTGRHHPMVSPEFERSVSFYNEAVLLVGVVSIEDDKMCIPL